MIRIGQDNGIDSSYIWLGTALVPLDLKRIGAVPDQPMTEVWERDWPKR